MGEPRNFFLILGLGEVLRQECLEAASGGTGLMGSGWSVQPKGLVHSHQSVLISCMRVGVHGQTRTSYTMSAPSPPSSPPKVQAHSFSRCAKVAPFCVGDFSLYLHVDDAGGFAKCCTRCGSRQEAARATVTPVPSARTANRRHAPGRESAPRRPTGTEQGQERGG